MNKTPFLALGLVGAALITPATAVAALDVPTATIGSVRGTGSKGCVKATKSVVFTLNSIDSGYFITRARVTLDGRTVSRKAWAIPTSLAAPPSPTFRDFKLSVNLRHLKAGRHRLRFYGTLIPETLGRHFGAHLSSTFTPPATSSLTGSVKTSKIITKCATAAFAG